MRCAGMVKTIILTSLRWAIIEIYKMKLIASVI